MSARKGHHGGAWKVAYADFVTAMMALFLVLWLTAQDERVKEAVERAFRNPFTSVTKDSVGIIPNKDTQAVRSQSGNFDSASAVELTMLRRLNQELNKSLHENSEESNDDSVKMELSPEGLRISVFDRAHKPVFESASSKFTDYGKWIFTILAWEIARYTTFKIELEGHTERGFQVLPEGTDDWDLSAERAIAARRVLIHHGVAHDQVRKLAGYADTMPMPDVAPEDEANRRVTVMLRVGSETKGDTRE